MPGLPLRVLAGGSAGFSPKNVAGLMWWHDASNLASITKDGSDLVSQWNDLSGNGNHLTQSTDGNKPKWVSGAVNNRAAIHFYHPDNATGSADVMTCADNATQNFNGRFYWFLVFAPLDLAAVASFQNIVGKWTSSGNQRGVQIAVTSADLLQAQTSALGGITTVSSQISGALSSGTTYLAEFWLDGTNQNLRRNNGTPDTDAQTTVFDGTGTLTYGAQDGTTSPYRGYICESICYNRVPTSEEITKLQSYLDRKWNW